MLVFAVEIVARYASRVIRFSLVLVAAMAGAPHTSDCAVVAVTSAVYGTAPPFWLCGIVARGYLFRKAPPPPPPPRATLSVLRLVQPRNDRRSPSHEHPSMTPHVAAFSMRKRTFNSVREESTVSDPRSYFVAFRFRHFSIVGSFHLRVVAGSRTD